MSGEAYFLVHRQCLLAIFMWQKGVRDPFGVSFRRALIPLMRAPPLWSNHLPKDPLPNTASSGLGFNIGILGWHKHSDYSSRTCNSNDNVCVFEGGVSVTVLVIIHLYCEYPCGLLSDSVWWYDHGHMPLGDITLVTAWLCPCKCNSLSDCLSAMRHQA